MIDAPAPGLVDTRNVARALGRLALPSAAAIASDQFLGVVDTIVMGTLGARPLAAVAAATTVFFVTAFVIHGLSSGGGILGAQAIGAREYDRFGRIVRASSFVPLAVAGSLSVAALIFGHAAMTAYVGRLGVADLATPYFILRSASLVPATIGGIAYSAFAAAGRTGFGMRLLLAINAVHIPLVLVLALGWGTHHPLGVTGAGISSLLAEIAGAAFSLVAFARAPELHVFRRLDLDVRLAWRIAVLSAPETVYLFLVTAPDIAIVAFLTPLGATVVAAFRVLTLVSDLTFSIPASLSSAAQTIIGQRLGASDYAGAERFDRRARRYGVLASTIVGAFVAVAAWPLALLITFNATLAAVAAAPLAVHMLTLPLKGYAMLGIAPVRAAGDTRFSMIVGIVASAAVIPAVAVCVDVLKIGLFAVPAAWLAGWGLWCLLTRLRLQRYRWSEGRLAA